MLGNTWFWPADEPRAKVFSKLMSTRLLQRQILERHRFVERTVALGVSRKLSASEMRHTGVQASPEARVGAAALPKQTQAAGPTLERLANDVPATLGPKPALFVWGMKDFVFPPGELFLACSPPSRITLPSNCREPITLCKRMRRTKSPPPSPPDSAETCHRSPDQQTDSDNFLLKTIADNEPIANGARAMHSLNIFRWSYWVSGSRWRIL